MKGTYETTCIGGILRGSPSRVSRSVIKSCAIEGMNNLRPPGVLGKVGRMFCKCALINIQVCTLFHEQTHTHIAATQTADMTFARQKNSTELQSLSDKLHTLKYVCWWLISLNLCTNITNPQHLKARSWFSIVFLRSLDRLSEDRPTQLKWLSVRFRLVQLKKHTSTHFSCNFLQAD